MGSWAVDDDGTLHVTTPPGVTRTTTTRDAATGTGPTGVVRRTTVGPTSPGHRSPALLTSRVHVSVHHRVG